MGIFKKKLVQIPIAIILWIIFLGISPKLWGAINLLGGIFLFYSLLYKNEKFKTKNKVIRTTVGTLIVLFTLTFSGVGLTYNEETSLAYKAQQEQIKQEKLKQDEQKKLEEKQKTDEEQAKKVKEEEEKKKADEAAAALANTNKANGELKVHFINVGQADSILVQQGNQTMLVDAGNNPDGPTVKNYISNLGINNLDYLVGTHPHEDHIGGLDYIINSFQIGKIYMPKTTANTATFKDVVTAAQSKGLSFTTPTPGESFKVGEATCTILAPNGSGYEDPNNYSIVIKVQFGSTSFLLSGDAENISENEMLSKGFDLSSTVLKVGHHGSDSSTTSNFLNKVNPKYAVISVGKGNTYGHPKQSTMDKLKAKGIEVYRTDENGTIVAISNGTTVTFNTQPGSYTGNSSSTNTNSGSTSSGGTTSSNTGGSSTVIPVPTPTPSPTPTPTTPPSSSQVVYWLTTKTSKSYHKNPNCSYIAGKTVNSGTIDDAIRAAHGDPCDRCAK